MKQKKTVSAAEILQKKVLLGENRQLNGTTPLLWVQNPLPVFFIGLSKEAVIEGEGVSCHSSCYHLPAHI